MSITVLSGDGQIAVANQPVKPVTIRTAPETRLLVSGPANFSLTLTSDAQGFAAFTPLSLDVHQTDGFLESAYTITAGDASHVVRIITMSAGSWIYGIQEPRFLKPHAGDFQNPTPLIGPDGLHIQALSVTPSQDFVVALAAELNTLRPNAPVPNVRIDVIVAGTTFSAFTGPDGIARVTATFPPGLGTFDVRFGDCWTISPPGYPATYYCQPAPRVVLTR